MRFKDPSLTRSCAMVNFVAKGAIKHAEERCSSVADVRHHGAHKHKADSAAFIAESGDCRLSGLTQAQSDCVSTAYEEKQLSIETNDAPHREQLLKAQCQWLRHATDSELHRRADYEG